jgi:outer membrane protein assembly factor BamD (BamD/ComL family)
MAGNVALDTWGDLPRSSFFFRELLERYPESDYAADAEYILANMNKPDFVHPRSIEDLQQNK